MSAKLRSNLNSRVTTVARLAGLTAVVLAVAAGSAQAEMNYAAGIRYGGDAKTKLDLGKTLARSHTIMVRYAAKYPYMHPGAVLGTSGSGLYGIGVGDFRRLQKGTFPSWDFKGRIQVKLGDRIGTFLVPQDPGIHHHWVHLALVVTRPKRRVPSSGVPARLYINGNRAAPAACDLPERDAEGRPVPCPDHTAGQDLRIPRAALAGIKGKLRLGQTSSRRTASPLLPFDETLDRSQPGRPILDQPGNDQFYGLIDDVAVFQGALGPLRIGALAKARRITGLEPGLTVAYNFDRGGRRGKARPVRFTKGRSGPIRVAKERLNKLNFAPLEKLRPPQKVAWTLPFDKGQEWYVLWGNNTPNSSHNGGASFSWDFVLAAPGLPAGADSNNSKTCGQRLRAVAPGKATLIDDDGISDKPDLYKDATNVLMGQLAHLEGVEYLHLQTHSVRQTFTATIPPPFISFARGQVVARVGARNLGPSNCHLHLASRATETGTIPREFSNYDLKNPQTGEWKRIARGVPATRDIVRNPPG